MTRKHNRNRIWIVLLIMAVAIVMAIPAAAKPPLCSENPEHPACIPDDPTDPPPDDEPLAGTTCNAIEEWEEPVESGSFTVTLTEDACIDVIASEGVWSVAVEEIGDGTLRWLSLVIRDSVAPGDACDSVSYRRDIPSEITLDGFENNGIAGAWVNSCGTDWAEWVEDTYYDYEDESVPSPLVLQVFMSGKDEKVRLTIDIP